MSGIYLKIDSQNITPPDTTSNFTVRFTSPLKLEGNTNDWEFALIHTSLWYNFYNVSTALGNNVIRYSHDSGSTWTTVTFPDGLYNITNLNNYLQQQIENNGHTVNKLKILANFSLLKVQLYIEAGSNYQVDLQSSVSSFHSFLGFDSGIYTSGGFTTAQNIANITNNINTLEIHCSLVNREYTYENGKKSDIIYTLSPNEPPGSLMIRSPVNPVYLPVNTTYIESIRMQITDDRNNQISFNGEQCTYVLHLKRIQ